MERVQRQNNNIEVGLKERLQRSSVTSATAVYTATNKKRKVRVALRLNKTSRGGKKEAQRDFNGSSFKRAKSRKFVKLKEAA